MWKREQPERKSRYLEEDPHQRQGQRRAHRQKKSARERTDDHVKTEEGETVLAEAKEEAQIDRHKAERGMEKREGALGAEELRHAKRLRFREPQRWGGRCQGARVPDWPPGSCPSLSAAAGGLGRRAHKRP